MKKERAIDHECLAFEAWEKRERQSAREGDMESEGLMSSSAHAWKPEGKSREGLCRRWNERIPRERRNE